MNGTVVIMALMLVVPWVYFAIKYHLKLRDWKAHEHLKTRIYWADHRNRIEKSGICPCCGHTFHHLVDKDERKRIYMPSGVYFTVTNLLKQKGDMQPIAVRVIMAALDAKAEIAQEIVLNWDQIESVQ